MIHWKSLLGLDDRFVGRWIAQQPSADEFAVILPTLFDGKPSPPREPAVLTENAWTLSELTTALAKMKANKSGDDSGIVFFCVFFFFAPFWTAEVSGSWTVLLGKQVSVCYTRFSLTWY